MDLSFPCLCEIGFSFQWLWVNDGFECCREQGMTMDRETGLVLDPKFDANGLITAVCTDADTGEVLMLAHMNAQALDQTLNGGKATFWSRSRQALWVKGESSGNYLHVVEARIDCDQDAIWLKCRPDGPACHTGANSCFFRIVDGSTLRPC
jgi:phosphoribosyl-AMP cyclohydrolase